MKLLAILILPLLLVVAYGLWPANIPTDDYALEKLDLSDLRQSLPWLATTQGDTLRQPLPQVAATAVDTTRQRILFIGDSMLEGLTIRMTDYAKANDYYLESVIWYSSTTKLWADTDTLQYYINKVKPTYVIICLGGNEQYTKNLHRCETNIWHIVMQLGDIPFVWISTPNWEKTSEFNDMVRKVVGEKRFFDSSHLSFERRSDHMHPTKASAEMWCDKIAQWMTSRQSIHPIRMLTPKEHGKERSHVHYLAI